MTINSRQKGARGEREAAKYLTKLGFLCKRNGRNGYSDDDLVCPALPRVHIEVKYGCADMDVGTARLEAAWQQAANNCGRRVPVVLWKPKHKGWRLSWWGKVAFEGAGVLLTVGGDDAVLSSLLRLDSSMCEWSSRT